MIKLSRMLRVSLYATSATAALAASASPALAQGAAPSAAAANTVPNVAADDSGTIVVTGSLLTNPNLAQAAPVNVTTAEEITLRQSNVAEEVLRDIPGIVPNIGSAVNNGNGGASFVDLRGLGTFRNIVLLDGTRIAPSNANGRVDLNNIPLALVERVDALTGGASTTYGADAVSGVVNFITRKDFSGVEVSIGEQITEQGDGNYLRADVTLGANFDDGRGNAVFSIGYQESDPVFQGDRNFSSTQYSSTTGRAAGSDVTVPAEFVLNNALVQIDPATGALGPVTQQFNFNPYNVFQTPFKRFNMYGAANYAVADGIELYTRGLFSKNTVNVIIAPSGVFDEVLNVPSANPFLPTAARTQFCSDTNTPLFDANGASINHDAAGTARCLASASITDPSAAGYTVIGIETLRRTPDVGPRISEFTTTVFDYRAGIRGDITDTIHFDLAGSYGESENIQTIKNFVLLSRAQQAVNATNATTCINPANGCVPLNIFGAAGSITPAQATFLTANSTTANKTSLAQARALISGDLGISSPWAAEPVSFAVGGEYRRYRASQASDLLAQTPGELGGAGSAAPNFSGGYDVYEALAEVGIPLISGKPFFDSLTINGGIRYSHYTVDTLTQPQYNTTTYKGELAWQPVRDIKLRGTYAHAVRAPNIAELFTPVTTTLTNLSTEPCVGAAPLTNANLAAVCRAQGAPASSIGSIAVPNSGQANITAGGNVNVKPEKSNSYTFGVVLQPSFLSGFSATVDYYHIKVTGAITTPTSGDILNACFGSLTAASATDPACTSIRRNPGTGQLSGSPATTLGLPGQLSNLGLLLTDGIDFSANYRRDLGLFKLGVSFSGNWTNRSKFKANAASASSVFRECVGFYSTNCGSIQPEFQWNMRTTLGFDDLDVSVLWRHIDGVRFEPLLGTRFSGALAGGDLSGQQANFNRIPAFNYFDLTTRFGITRNVDLTLGVQNLFDKKPPVVGNTIGQTTFNSGNTYPSTYDALGRRYAAGVKLKF